MEKGDKLVAIILIIVLAVEIIYIFSERAEEVKQGNIETYDFLKQVISCEIYFDTEKNILSAERDCILEAVDNYNPSEKYQKYKHTIAKDALLLDCFNYFEDIEKFNLCIGLNLGRLEKEYNYLGN